MLADGKYSISRLLHMEYPGRVSSDYLKESFACVLFGGQLLVLVSHAEMQ